jgi:hypothetical protein
VEYRLLRGALGWRVGPLPRMGHGARWSLIAAAGAGVLAAGLRSMVDDVPSLVALVVVVGPAVAAYLLITHVMQVPEAVSLVRRARRALPSGRARPQH